jgi:hypothetical protein
MFAWYGRWINRDPERAEKFSLILMVIAGVMLAVGQLGTALAQLACQ